MVQKNYSKNSKKSKVEDLDDIFSGLMLYQNSDIDFINYVTNKILTEAKNLLNLKFAYVDVNLDRL